MSGIKDNVLRVSGYVLPWIFGIAFALGDFGYIGAGITVAICLWYGAWNWRAVIHWKWAMVVIAFFAAIALKSGIMWLLGEEPFVSFAKAGSRIISLFGVAAILVAYNEGESETILGRSLGLLAVLVSIITLLIRIRLIPRILNPNSFGMDCCWFFLYLVVRFRRKESPRGSAAAVIAGLFGAALILSEGFLNDGSRTAPVAYLVALLFIYIAPIFDSRRFSIGLILAVVAGIAILSFTFSNSVDEVLTHRQELWNAYATKGSERPLLGWGYADPLRARALVGSLVKGDANYEWEFMHNGDGPHNSFLSMFFENGAISLVLFVILLVSRAKRTMPRPDLFDASFVAFIIFMSADAMNVGGITFLGFFLGMCVLAGGADSRVRKT